MAEAVEGEEEVWSTRSVGIKTQLECNEEAEWGERCVDVMWSHGLWCTDSPVGWVCDEDHEREENGF